MPKGSGRRELKLLLNEQERSVWRGLLHAYNELTRELDLALRAHHDVPLSSYEVLAQLYLEPSHRLRLTELAGRLVFTRSGVTRLIDRLEEQGLVTRCEAADDARGVYAVLTDRGLDRFDEGRYTYVAVLRERFFGRLRDGELAELDELWTRLRPPAGQ